MAKRLISRCRIADCASSTNFAGTLKLVFALAGSVGNSSACDANNSGCLLLTRQVTSAGFTPFSTKFRAAVRQPSKSVSLSRVMKCIFDTHLSTPVMAGLCPGHDVFAPSKEDVDARHKAGHDEFSQNSNPS